MTLVRTALRLATVAALQGTTLAENRVYDSRISDFSPEAFTADAKPTIIILTDADEGEQLSQQNGGPPFSRMVDLVFEIGMVQTGQDDDGAFVPGYPSTDARHEASLDYLEFQIARCLGYDPAAIPTLWRSFSRPTKTSCHRQVMDEAGVKIACRILTWTCNVSDDQVEVYNDPNEALPTGLDALPDPLRTVAKALPAGSSGLEVCTTIATAITSLTAPQLAGVDFKYTDHRTDPAAPSDVEQTVNLPAAP